MGEYKIFNSYKIMEKITEQTKLMKCLGRRKNVLELAQKNPLAESIHANDISKWMNATDEQELTDDIIVEAVMQNSNHSHNENKSDNHKKSHIWTGSQQIRMITQYIE